MSNIDSSEIKDLSSIVTQLPQIMTRYLMIQNGFADNYIVLNYTAYKLKVIIFVFHKLFSVCSAFIIACMLYMIIDNNFSEILIYILSIIIPIGFVFVINYKTLLFSKLKAIKLSDEHFKFLIWCEGIMLGLTIIMIITYLFYFNLAHIHIINSLDKTSYTLGFTLIAVITFLIFEFLINAIMKKIIQEQISKPLGYYKKYQPTASLHTDDNTVFNIDANMILWIDKDNRINILDKKKNTYILEDYVMVGNSKLIVRELNTNTKRDITESNMPQFFNTFP